MEDVTIVDWEVISAQKGMRFEQSDMFQQGFSGTRF
jgi:hypothetical protein